MDSCNICLNTPEVCITVEDNNIEVELNKPHIEVELEAGAQGQKGDPGKDATINGVNAINILPGENITIDQEGDDLTINASGEVSLDYNNITNKPKINDIIVEGQKTGSDYNLVTDENYVHTDNNFTTLDKERTEGFVYTQGSPSETWTIVHNLNKYPSCTIINSAGDEVYGEIFYNNTNSITVTFSGAFSGKAFLN